ncbi:hypothetical protein M2145_001179 [Lachnospiraceae bacterium PF1-21]|nr:hypothetical protein [Ohessyouella blattaphilus]
MKDKHKQEVTEFDKVEPHTRDFSRELDANHLDSGDTYGIIYV